MQNQNKVVSSLLSYYSTFSSLDPFFSHHFTLLSSHVHQPPITAASCLHSLGRTVGSPRGCPPFQLVPRQTHSPRLLTCLSVLVCCARTLSLAQLHPPEGPSQPSLSSPASSSCPTTTAGQGCIPPSSVPDPRIPPKERSTYCSSSVLWRTPSPQGSHPSPESIEVSGGDALYRRGQAIATAERRDSAYPRP